MTLGYCEDILDAVCESLLARLISAGGISSSVSATRTQHNKINSRLYHLFTKAEKDKLKYVTLKNIKYCNIY